VYDCIIHILYHILACNTHGIESKCIHSFGR